MWNQSLVPVSIHAINNILSNSLRWIFQISIMKCVDHLTAMGLCVDNALKVMVYIPVYSYDLSCVECTDYKYNWLKYMAVAYGPLTVFYFIIIIFRISANSGSMIGYVTISQMVSNTYLNYIYLKNPHSVVITRLFVLFNSIWNLNFFRSLYPPFCLHPHLSALQAISLDYIVAI